MSGDEAGSTSIPMIWETTPLQEAHPALIAQAWHDVTCPEGPECRDRIVHSAAQTIANTGHLAAFLTRLAELHAGVDRAE